MSHRDHFRLCWNSWPDMSRYVCRVSLERRYWHVSVYLREIERLYGRFCRLTVCRYNLSELAAAEFPCPPFKKQMECKNVRCCTREGLEYQITEF